MSAQKTILVTGATGRLGGALITNLLASPAASTFKIIAVTRDPATGGAQRLAALPGVSVIQGDLSDVPALFERAGPVWGVFSVQVNSDAEDAQARAMVDAAVANGAQHFVYGSGDRGGPERSAVDPTTVKNFATKFGVEKYLMEQAASSKQGMTWTILRPVTFFENLTDDINGRAFARMWAQMGQKRLQMVATADIGWFGADSFARPAETAGKAISIVGDALTQKEADAIFKDVTGRHMPIAMGLIASTVKLVLKDTVGDMFRWFGEFSGGASVEDCRAMYPALKDFRAWVVENQGNWAKCS